MAHASACAICFYLCSIVGLTRACGTNVREVNSRALFLYVYMVFDETNCPCIAVKIQLGCGASIRSGENFMWLSVPSSLGVLFKFLL